MREIHCIKVLMEAGANPSFIRTSDEPLTYGDENGFMHEVINSLSMVCFLLTLINR